MFLELPPQAASKGSVLSPSANSKSELKLFLDEFRMRRSDDLDILSYWKTNQCRYPILAAIVRDILGINVSTVASEAAFSVGGRILDQFCSSLKPDTVEAIICSRDWLFGSEVGIKTVDKDMDDVIQNVVDLNIDEEKTDDQDSKNR
ncbi:hypothetical protein TIFTF001_007670 [Ficus carica]|uniref:HAT C-terminal dimerisation domain-containing protein n=1 Tax=Ficus carica TaxID=3494 RepID=A0AA88DGK7_FICCA|nr:hypothetical protein TIFTF001_007670 [Ficus carica]